MAKENNQKLTSEDRTDTVIYDSSGNEMLRLGFIRSEYEDDDGIESSETVAENTAKTVAENTTNYLSGTEFAPIAENVVKNLTLSDEAKKLQAEGIVSGGNINTFNVNINSITGVDTLNTTTFAESSQEIGRQVKNAILEQLADIRND